MTMANQYSNNFSLLVWKIQQITMPTRYQYPLWLIFECIGIMLQLKTSEVTPNLATISEDVKIYENTSVVKEAIYVTPRRYG